jgi:hypothetical protein
MAADAFCKLVFEAPRRQLEAKCSAEDKARPEYTQLLQVASRPVASCALALEPGVAQGRLKLHKQKAEACARAIESAPWKTSLRTRELSQFAECAGLSTGTQAESAACRTGLDCQPDLWCSGASFQDDGRCQKRVAAGAKCEAPLLFLFDEVSSSCVAGQACDFGAFRPAYALGYPPLVSAELTREQKKREPAPEASPDAAASARAQALKEAADFGMIGLMNSSDGGARGEGIGLGSIGTIGNSGPSRGLLGGKEAPRVRMGATTVKGRLPPEVVQRIVRQNFGRFRLCYENGLKANPKLEGRVSVTFVIDRSGAVGSVKADGDMPDRAVRDCVARAFHGLSFPAPEGGIVTVVYPILFSPPEGAATGLRGPDAVDAGTPSETDAGTPPPAAPAPPSDKSFYEPLVCVAKAATGAECRASHQCAAGLSCRIGRCDAPGKAGDACTADTECGADLYCGAKVDASGASGVCKPLGAAGATCTDSGECRGACVDQKCVAFCGAG